MQSLGSAISSHSIFYQSFRDDTKRIVQGILRNQIPPELMQYAAAAFETKFVDNNDEVKVGTLLRSAFEGIGCQQNGVQFQEWCLEWIFDHNVDGTGFPTALITRLGDQTYQSMGAVSIANVFSKTHSIVEYFCGRFARERLPLIQHLMVGRRPEACPSKREAFRIRRALYRFQIYCNLLFRNENDFRPGRRVRQMRSSYIVRHFFGCFSPWVDEQLACIHDYLEDILSRAFDDVAAHDVDWGAKSVDWLAQGKRNEYKQAYLTYGLPFLFKLDNNHGYQQRHQLLVSKGLPRTTVALAVHLQRAVPNNYTPHINTWSLYLRDRIPWGSEQEAHLMGRWGIDHDGADGMDSAPFRLWLAAHLSFWARDIPYCPEDLYLRKCGYVIWDIPLPEGARPEVNGEIKQWLKDCNRQSLIDTIERQRGRDQMKMSWKERAAISERGGRGYWSPDGLHDISWN
ncbi:hypothetical protein N8I77_010763 [Diaporthe amygdali]|uniref:Uncharacterized protein n=1 Tax=Phomopsis amygdali TaxID=1214568 RepID=A0AAD9W261_PHOAM|nr:hypothetical protein N8I77_010763 [Diaporthe amygdali]